MLSLNELCQRVFKQLILKIAKRFRYPRDKKRRDSEKQVFFFPLKILLTFRVFLELGTSYIAYL